MKAMKVNPFIFKWYHYFPTGRSQLVGVIQTHSHSLTTNTGAPQGCVSSPLLYTLYINDCTSTTSENFIVKFADDSSIVSLLFAHSNIDMYFFKVNHFTEWCTDNFLELNTPKIFLLKKRYLIPNQFACTCQWLSVIKPSNKLGHTSIWVFTLTANSAGVYMLKLCVPGPRSISTFSGDSEHWASVQTYCCCSIVPPLKAWLDMA